MMSRGASVRDNVPLTTIWLSALVSPIHFEMRKGVKMDEIKNEELDEEIVEVVAEDEGADESDAVNVFNCFNC